MGGLHTFLELEELTAETMNAYVSENTLPKFVSTAARDAAILAPVDGQQCYTADTGTVWTYITARAAWWAAPSWTTPRGPWTVSVPSPANFTFSATLAGSPNTGITFQKGRAYRVDWSAVVNTQTVSGTVDSVWMAVSGDSPNRQGSIARVTATGVSQSWPAVGWFIYTATVTGQVLFKLYAQAAAGGNQQVADIIIVAQDLGGVAAP